MSRSIYHSLNQLLLSSMVYTVLSWTFLLTVVAGVASLSPVYVFMSAISPSSYLSMSCVRQGFARLPLDVPREVICIPVGLVKPSGFDALVPFVIAGLIVGASANLIKNVLWVDDHIDPNYS